ncbi:MAG: fatty acid desaturase [Fimbriimonadaceae bacterium]|nr:fatty acid desaturase [Fimbriimonadaceae bacterium]
MDETANAIPRYRQVLRQALPDRLFRPDNLHLLWAIPHILVIAAGIASLTLYFGWWAPLVSLVIGHSFGCLGFMAHEVAHGTAIKSKFLKSLVAGVAFSPFAIGPYLWSRWHNAAHHSHTQHEELDPDRLFTVEEYKNSPVLRFLYRMHPALRNIVIFSSFGYRMSQHNFLVASTYLKSDDYTKAEKFRIVWQFVLPKVLWITGTLLLGWKVLLFGYLIPLMVANFIVIAYIATNHFLNPLADENDVLATTLSVTLPGWLKWLDPVHLHFGAHVAHHLFPQAPTRFARRIEKEIRKLWPDRYHEMPMHKALKALWDTPWVYAEDGKALIDPQVGRSAPTLGNGLDRWLRLRKRIRKS